MRTPIIAANWKMNKGPAETEAFLNEFLQTANAVTDSCEVVVGVPFVNLPKAGELLAESSVALAAQNVSQFDSGAYTGEVSTGMLKEVGVEFVILGHSERRSIFGESDEVINAKVKKTLEAGLKPIFCIGETLDEREAGQLEAVLTTQVTGGLKDVSAEEVVNLVVAYEPVWAIGTGVTASPEQAQASHAKVRAILAEMYGAETAAQVRIQYGGSMKAANSAELLGQEDIDGGLVGGASLEAGSFLELIQNGVGA